MRRFMWALMLCVLAVGAGTIWYPYLAAERVQSELTKLLCGQNVDAVLREFSDVLAVPIPELRPMFGFEQHNPHWRHAGLMPSPCTRPSGRTKRPSFASRCRVPSGRRRQRHTQALLRRNASRPI